MNRKQRFLNVGLAVALLVTTVLIFVLVLYLEHAH